MDFEKLVSTIYGEEDFGRSVGTAVAGVAGLVAYRLTSDWVIGVFTAVIAFPVVRVIATAINTRWGERRATSARAQRELDEFGRFSASERQVIEFFVQEGGCCVSWSAVNRSGRPFPRAAVNSLIQRGVVHTTVMEDGMTEAFSLDADIFDLAQRVFAEEQAGSGDE